MCFSSLSQQINILCTIFWDWVHIESNFQNQNNDLPKFLLLLLRNKRRAVYCSVWWFLIFEIATLFWIQHTYFWTFKKHSQYCLLFLLLRQNIDIYQSRRRKSTIHNFRKIAIFGKNSWINQDFQENKNQTV